MNINALLSHEMLFIFEIDRSYAFVTDDGRNIDCIYNYNI